MTNASILAAFERMWQHIVSRFATQSYTDAALSQKSQVQIITWEADD